MKYSYYRHSRAVDEQMATSYTVGLFSRLGVDMRSDDTTTGPKGQVPGFNGATFLAEYFRAPRFQRSEGLELLNALRSAHKNGSTEISRAQADAA